MLKKQDEILIYIRGIKAQDYKRYLNFPSKN